MVMRVRINPQLHCGVFLEGHFFNCTYRVVTALYRLRNRVICWPDEIARRRESMINHNRGGFIGAVGKLDGTDIVLENKPGK